MARTIDPDNKNRSKVLAAYRANPEATQRELAAASGVAFSTMRYHLMKLEEDGLVVLRKTYRVTIKRKSKHPEALKSQERRTEKKMSNKELQKRIDMVVAKALAREGRTQHDVVRHVNRPLKIRGGAHKQVG